MNGQILSILSHVVHGYVGNRAITFPLQYLGWNVDALNTVNLSNHPGYGKFSGKVEEPELIGKVLTGLKNIGNSVGEYNMVLTGYLPNDEIIETVKQEIFESFKDCKRKPLLIMDPILGDNGKIYVKETIIPVYKEILKSGLVDLITPNQFEFEVLTGVTISDFDSLSAAIHKFNADFDVKNLVLSSVNVGDDMYSLGYTRESSKAFLVPIKEIPCKFFGCGDLLTGLISHGFHLNKGLTPAVLKDCITKLTMILQKTLDIERQRTGKQQISVVNDIKIIPLASILDRNYDSVEDVEYIDI